MTVDDVLVCSVCHRHVDERDPDAELDPPLCGRCVRNREEDLLWEMDAADGELDGEIG